MPFSVRCLKARTTYPSMIHATCTAHTDPSMLVKFIKGSVHTITFFSFKLSNVLTITQHRITAKFRQWQVLRSCDSKCPHIHLFKHDYNRKGTHSPGFLVLRLKAWTLSSSPTAPQTALFYVPPAKTAKIYAGELSLTHPTNFRLEQLKGSKWGGEKQSSWETSTLSLFLLLYSSDPKCEVQIIRVTEEN
jgi:hypothetical protein